jgi:tetratricopeptide (TPR) repeat protein
MFAPWQRGFPSDAAFRLGSNSEPEPHTLLGMTAAIPELVGRQSERDELAAFCADALAKRPAVLLVSGEAGVGKTRLVHDVAASCGLRILAAGANPTAAFGPVAGVLRQWLREPGSDLGSCGPLTRHLALLLPELGDPPEEGADSARFAAALRCALEVIGAQVPTAIVLDDLHQADHATLEALPALAASLGDTRLLIVGHYRSEEIGSGHPVRRLRSTLRREGTGRELHVEPLDATSISALIGSLLGTRPAPMLVELVNRHAQGVPFFAEELTRALYEAGRLVETPAGVALATGCEVPLPVTISDAVMVRTDGMSLGSRHALEIAAVAGVRFDLALVAALSTRGTLDEAIERGLVGEEAPGRGGFRHTFVREAVYAGVPWTRRRTIHRRIAEYLEAEGAPAGVVAEHWISAREPARARITLRLAADAARRLHAHRDAMRAFLRALDLWPEAEQEAERIAMLTDLGECAQLSGDLGQAARAWREVVERQRRCGDVSGVARAHRSLAGVYTLEGSSQRSIDAWLAAAVGFAACALHVDAAECRLAAATLLQYSGRVGGALEALNVAAPDVERSARIDVQLRALTLEGIVRGKLGRPTSRWSWCAERSHARSTTV